MQATVEAEKRQEKQQDSRTMGVDERMEQLKQKQLYRQTRSVDYRDAFDAGWDAGREYERKERADVQG